MRRATIVAFVLFAASCLSLAQDRALISGDAEDKQDTPVPGVRVTLRNESLRIVRTTTTNSDGFYFFAEVAPAEGYVITAEAPGMEFVPQSVKFEVEVGETRHILPSFIADKVAGPISSRHDWRPPNSTCRAEQVSAGVPPAIQAKRPVPAVATSLKPAQVVSAVPGSTRLGPRRVAYVSGQPAASDRRSVDNLTELGAAGGMEMKRALGCIGRGVVA